MSLDQPTCPTCAGALVLTTSGELDTWNCGAGHGLGMTLSEGYGRVQEDELHELWVASGAVGANNGVFVFGACVPLGARWPGRGVRCAV